MVVTIEQPKTVQEISIAYTGHVGFVDMIKTVNKLSGDLLFAGQKITIPDVILSPAMKATLAPQAFIDKIRFAAIPVFAAAVGVGAFLYFKRRKA